MNILNHDDVRLPSPNQNLSEQNIQVTCKFHHVYYLSFYVFKINCVSTLSNSCYWIVWGEVILRELRDVWWLGFYLFFQPCFSFSCSLPSLLCDHVELLSLLPACYHANCYIVLFILPLGTFLVFVMYCLNNNSSSFDYYPENFFLFIFGESTCILSSKSSYQK